MPEDHPYRKNPSVADLRRERAADEAAKLRDRIARHAALRVIERWNAERRTSRSSPLWSPTIRCAVVAGTPWLDVYCPGCSTSRAIDIRTLDRHPLASVGSLVLGLRCSWCPGSAPMPVLTGLHAVPPAARWSRNMPVEFLHGLPLSGGKKRRMHRFDRLPALHAVTAPSPRLQRARRATRHGKQNKPSLSHKT